eukprot:Gb_04181 [translate_table: standard]
MVMQEGKGGNGVGEHRTREWDEEIEGKGGNIGINLAQETLHGILAHWLSRRRQKMGTQTSTNGTVPSVQEAALNNHISSKVDVHADAENCNSGVLPAFEFSMTSPPSIITEGSQGGPWRKKITELDGTEDEKELPWWCIECVLHGRIPPREQSK